MPSPTCAPALCSLLCPHNQVPPATSATRCHHPGGVTSQPPKKKQETEIQALPSGTRDDFRVPGAGTGMWGHGRIPARANRAHWRGSMSMVMKPVPVFKARD